MRALLDVNIIIALFDPDHTFHDRAHNWWAKNSKSGWASCPLTENGVVRIMSNPGYSKATVFNPGELVASLQRFVSQTDHEFWVDDLSLRDHAVFAPDRMHGSRHLTDLYLAALAAKRGGRLVTFDRHVPLAAVRSATADNLCVI